MVAPDRRAVSPRAAGAEYEEELRFHMEMREERNAEEGMGTGEARRAARVRFGNPEVLRERISEVDLMLFPQTVWQDLRFGARMLARQAGFTAGAVFALAVGIGMNTATFTAYRAFFERKLDARDPATMVNLALIEHNGTTEPKFSYPDYEAYRDHIHSFSGVIRCEHATVPAEWQFIAMAGRFAGRSNGAAARGAGER